MLLASTILADPAVKALATTIGDSPPPLAVIGLWGSAAPVLAAVLTERLARPCLYVTAHLDQADDARDDMETILGRGADVLPAWETLPGEGSGAGEIGAARTRICSELRQDLGLRRPDGRDETGVSRSRVLVAPIQAVMQPLPSVEALDANALCLSVGDERDPETICSFLHDRGFSRLDQVEDPGDFALRGGILDIFWSTEDEPVRIEFFGNHIESIRRFDLGSQRSTRPAESVRVTLPPVAARLRPSDTTSIFTYLDPRTVVFLHEPAEIAEIGRAVLDRLGNPVGHYSVESVFRSADRFASIHLSRFATASVPDERSIPLPCETLPTFEAKAADAIDQLRRLAASSPVVVFCENKGEEERLGELLAQGVTKGASESAAAIHDSPVNIHTHIGLLHAGFRWNPAASAGGAVPSIVALPHHELFRRYAVKRRLRKVAAARPIESFLDLSPGDYVVHVTHGIGKYLGMKTMKKGDSRASEEFLTLRFADDATIHVPVAQIDLVQKYVGARAARPPLSKIGGSRWKATKERVEEAVDELAADLLRVQAVRESQAGTAFPGDTHWQTEFESAFPYTETPDQLAALREIKTDMSRARSMDRLLCGDVGYGKTELAIRAAFKAAEFGKQTAVLVPTTVLAEQHLRTFTERLRDYPFVVECLSRFRSAKEQKAIIGAARAGRVDVLIGTHRLLSKDVGFADLGLVVVDEEQRFGVEHKERLKRLRETVEVLTLTATPIPRTLHMAMIGLRDISSLASPPMDRRSISTTVCPWSDDVIREAVVRELNRDGQVYFVHNRVHSIARIAQHVQTLVPEARIAVGHGQMPGEELEEVMLRFVRREADVLVCTSIIESGLDIPNANTILIDRADRFGLADLHQLRGRVGRYKHRAYCYLMIPPNRPLTSTAARRLKAIEEFSELGSGFRIAMRDLEIRGAGNILGPQQSGHIAAVGYELYCQMLERSVKRMKGEPARERVSVHVDLNLEAYLPRSYIPSDRQRMECYRRVAGCVTPRDVEQLGEDLRDAFGPLPETVETLLALTEIRVRAAAWNIKSIIRREPDVVFTYEGEVRRLEPLFAGATGSIRIPDARTFHWRLPDNYFHGNSLLRILTNLLRRAEPAPILGTERQPSRDAEPAMHVTKDSAAPAK